MNKAAHQKREEMYRQIDEATAFRQAQPDKATRGSTIGEMKKALRFLKSRDCARRVEVDGYSYESFNATKTDARRMIRDRIAENEEILKISDDFERERRFYRQEQFDVSVWDHDLDDRQGWIKITIE